MLLEIKKRCVWRQMWSKQSNFTFSETVSWKFDPELVQAGRFIWFEFFSCPQVTHGAKMSLVSNQATNFGAAHGNFNNQTFKVQEVRFELMGLSVSMIRRDISKYFH